MRVGTIVFGRSHLQDRNEEEVRGYRDALNLIHDEGSRLPLSEDTVLRLHSLCRGGIGDAGRYKERESDIIERAPDGSQRVRFRTVPAREAPGYLRETLDLWREGIEARWVHPLILLASSHLDFLCIHPFRDGNGRVSRLLLLLQAYHLGYEVGRYISLERLIEEGKERYYETLEASSQQWRRGEHDPSPYISYLLYILKSAYGEFEERVGEVHAPKGSKAVLVENAVRKAQGEFRLVDIANACPGVGREWIRSVLARMRRAGEVLCKGRGPAARWRYLGGKGSTPK